MIWINERYSRANLSLYFTCIVQNRVVIATTLLHPLLAYSIDESFGQHSYFLMSLSAIYLSKQQVLT